MSKTFTDLTAEGRKYFMQLDKLENYEVWVGFPDSSVTYEDDTSVVEIATYNEYGTSDIPSRPFMTQSFENKEYEIKKVCEDANASISNGGSADSAFNKIGETCKEIIQNEIENGSFEPNADSTILKKGFDQPLIDTGTMKDSVDFVVKMAE